MAETVQFRAGDSLGEILQTSACNGESLGTVAKRDLTRYHTLITKQLRELSLTQEDLGILATLVNTMPIHVPMLEADLYTFAHYLSKAAGSVTEYKRFGEMVDKWEPVSSAIVAITVENALITAKGNGIAIRNLLEAGFPAAFRVTRTADIGLTSISTDPTMSTKKGHVVTIAGTAGGAGTTAVALNLAAYIGTHTDKSVVLVDFDIQNADVGKYVGEYHAKTVVELLPRLAETTPENITECLAYNREGSFYSLLGPHDPRYADPGVLNSRVYQNIIKILVHRFDYVIIDTPIATRYHDLVTGFAMPAADKILFTITQNWTNVHNARLYLDQLTKQSDGPKLDAEDFNWILNRYNPDIADATLEDIKLSMAAYNYVGTIEETSEFRKAGNNFELALPLLDAKTTAMFKTIYNAIQ